ncbi:MAG: lactonase family protein [Caldimonas sp.]
MSVVRTIAYVANADSHDISVLRLDPDTGSAVEVERVAVGGTVMPLAVSPDRRYLYASIRSAPVEVLSFAIDAVDGQPALLGRSALPASMCWIGTDRSGRFLLSASYGESVVAVSPIGADGVAGPAQQTVATAANAHSVQTDPANRFAFAACLGGGVVLGYRFDAASGRLSAQDEPAWRSRAGAGPRHFAFHRAAPFVCLLHELDASIDVLAYAGETGRWSHVQTISALPPGFAAGAPWAAEIRFTPDGRFLYASERRSSTLAAFTVDAASGRLAPIGHAATETQPRGFAIDPSGRCLLAAGQTSHGVRIHAIDAVTGRLVERARLAVGQNPNWVEIVALDAAP